MNFVVQKVIHESSYAYNLSEKNYLLSFVIAAATFSLKEFQKCFSPFFLICKILYYDFNTLQKVCNLTFFFSKFYFVIRYARLCDVELILYIKLVYKWSRNVEIYPESFWTVARLFRYCCCFRVQLCWECGTWLICRKAIKRTDLFQK